MANYILIIIDHTLYCLLPHKLTEVHAALKKALSGFVLCCVALSFFLECLEHLSVYIHTPILTGGQRGYTAVKSAPIGISCNWKLI